MAKSGTPNTSVPTHPHKGSLGQTHVDILHHGSDGRVEHRTTHVTDRGHVRWGERKAAFDKGKK